MIQLLYIVILAEMALIMILLFKTPLRKLVVLTLDRVKRGKGPVVVKTVAGTLFMVLLSSLYSVSTIHDRTDDLGGVNPTDQVLMAMHMLEATLMAFEAVEKWTDFDDVVNRRKFHKWETSDVASFCKGFVLFLSLMIDRLHHYIRELRLLRKTMEAAKKQSRGFEDGKNGNPDEFKKLMEEAASLRTRMKEMESECKTNANKTKNAVAEARRKPSEGLPKYDRLLEDNQNLRNQLKAMEQSFSNSDGKKNM